MAGSNNIPKFLEVNRENEILNFKIRSATYTQVDTALAGNALTTAKMFLPGLTLDATTTSPITAPTVAQIFQELEKRNLATPGTTFSTVYHNSTNAAIVVNFPTLGSVTLPANSYTNVGFVVTGNNPNTLAFYSPSNIPSGGGGSPVFPGTTGILSLSGGGTLTTVTITGTSPIIVTNGNGQGGNPTISFSGATVFGNTAGYVTTDGVGNTVARTLTGSSYVIVTNGNGQGGNATFNVNTALQALSDAVSSASPPTGILLKTTQNGATSFQGSSTTVPAFYPTSGTNIKIYAIADDVLVWNGTQWVGSQSSTRWPCFNNLAINNNFMIAAGTSQTYDSAGSPFVFYAQGGWGSTAATTGGRPLISLNVTDTNVGANVGSASKANFILSNVFNTSGNAFTSQNFRFYNAFNTNAAATMSPTSDGTTAFAGGGLVNEVFLVSGQGDFAGYGFGYVRKAFRCDAAISCVSLVQTSTRETKRDILPVEESVLPLLDKLDPVTFNYHVDPKGTSKRVGLIVDDLAEKLKEDTESLLHGLISRDDHGKPLALDHGNLLGLLLTAVKELKAEIQELKKKI